MVIGSGGREHAIAWKAAQNKTVDEVLCVPGNGGTAFENKCRNVDCKSIDEMVETAKKENVDITIVGPENYLVDGIADRFKSENLKIFGPSKKAAQLEGSKVYAKQFMDTYNVKTAKYKVFEKSCDAIEYIAAQEFPIVVKADGLAAGKGVIIAQNVDEGINAIHEIMDDKMFKDAGNRVVIEEYLEGKEASIFAVTDGKTMVPFLSAMDYKKAHDGDEGLNTGGMGSIAPNPYYTKEVQMEFTEKIMNPTLNGIKTENMDYCGIVFFGIMITNKGVYLLEYNVRMGDPETQALMPIMKSDYVEMAEYAAAGKLSEFKLEWEDKHSVCITAVSGGYPQKFEKGYEISGIESAKGKIFIAGAVNDKDKVVTCGGRVLNSVSTAETLNEAKYKSYDDIAKISFKDMYYRKDIAKVR